MRLTRSTTYSYAALAMTVIALVSCGDTETSGIEALKAELDSLKQVRSEVESHILAVEEQIDLMDTTVKSELVTAYTADQGTFKHYFDVYGNVQTDKAVTLFPESSGVVTSIRVVEGQRVSKGTVIMILDTELIEKNIQEVETSLDLANTLFEKQQRLWEQNIGSEVQYLEAKNRKETLENSLETLREQRNKGTVRAPFGGVVDEILPKIGELASVQMPAARLVSLEELYITADVTERYITDVAEGDSVTIVCNREDTIHGAIGRVGRVINPTNRSFSIRVELAGESAALRPNSLVAMKVNDFTRNEVVSIPSALIMQDGNGDDYVYVVAMDERNRKIARKRNIATTMSYGGKTMVSEGLENGELIINKGSRSVRDGDLIEVTKI